MNNKIISKMNNKNKFLWLLDIFKHNGSHVHKSKSRFSILKTNILSEGGKERALFQ